MMTKREFCEATIKYLDEHFAECTVADIAEALHYSERVFLRKFKEYYGVPFMTFLKKMQLHRAALEICRNQRVLHVRKWTTFATAQSFSKAFKKAYGAAPRQFLQAGKKVPDLVVEYRISERPVEVRYVDMSSSESEWLKGSLLTPIYAELSVPNRGGYQIEEEIETISELYAYSIKQWLVMNGRSIPPSAKVFGRHSKEKISIFVPLYQNEAYKATENVPEVAADRWIAYMDEHIREKINIKDVAKHFGYSERHFYDIFLMHFHIRPGHYVKKRRLFLAAKDLQSQRYTTEEIAKTYQYSSVNAFRRAFFKAFKTRPEEYFGEEYKVDNMKQYYTENKDKVRIRFADIASCYMRDSAFSSENRQDTSGDLTDDIVDRLLDESIAGRKIVVWKTVRKRSECLVGEEILKTNEPYEADSVFIKGGRYAIIESLNSKDSENLKEIYLMLYRLAFAGWLWENWSSIDFARLSFVSYEGEKLYFYVPVL